MKEVRKKYSMILLESLLDCLDNVADSNGCIAALPLE